MNRLKNAWPSLFSLVVIAHLVGDASVAHAQETEVTSWWIEARPWTYSALIAPFAREVELACDAAGKTCRVAHDEKDADRSAVLDCAAADGRWVLEAEGRDGRRLWAVALEGDRDERLRRAALWVARGEGDGAPAVAKVPESVSPPATYSGTSESTGGAVARDATEPREDAKGGGLALSALGAYTSSEGSHWLLAGARGLAVTRLTGGPRLGLAFDAEHSLNDGGGGEGLTGDITAGHLGVALAFGAPWTDDWVGISGEAGGALAKGTLHFSWGDSSFSYTKPYLKLSLLAQWPRREGPRPFVGLSYVASSVLLNQLTLDVGAAWSLW